MNEIPQVTCPDCGTAMSYTRATCPNCKRKMIYAPPSGGNGAAITKMAQELLSGMGKQQREEIPGITRIVSGILCVECPKCKTDYNRDRVIEEIKKQSPLLLDFSIWTTKFHCQVCGTLIIISSADTTHTLPLASSSARELPLASSSSESRDQVANAAVAIWLLSFATLLVLVWWQPFGHFGFWLKVLLSFAAFVAASLLMVAVDSLVKRIHGK